MDSTQLESCGSSRDSGETPALRGLATSGRSAAGTEIGATDSFPAPTVSTADILKFLIDRTGYIKLLEDEDTPEAYSRIENLRELVNAAMDSRDRAETLDQFLDHAALVSRRRRLRRARPDHADEPARRQGTGVSFGLSQRPGRRTVSTFAHHACTQTISKRSGGFATSA